MKVLGQHNRTTVPAKNFNFDAAKKQLLHLSRTAAEDWLNSVLVEAYSMLHYRATTGVGQLCTCRGVSVPAIDLPLGDEPPVLTPAAGVSTGKSFTVTMASNPVFQDEVDGVEIEEGMANIDLDLNNGFLLNPIDTAKDCGICYRRGFQPGFELHRGNRLVLTTLNYADLQSVTVENGEGPQVFWPNTDDAWTKFVVNVPRYWSSVRSSVFLNTNHTDLLLYSDPALTTPLTAADFAADTIDIYVGGKFTHVVIEFDSDVDQLKVSLPQLQSTRDYARFVTVPTSTLIVASSADCHNDDILFCPQLNLMWEVVDVKPLTMTDGYNVGWEVQGRIVQPVESLRHMICPSME